MIILSLRAMAVKPGRDDISPFVFQRTKRSSMKPIRQANITTNMKTIDPHPKNGRP